MLRRLRNLSLDFDLWTSIGIGVVEVDMGFWEAAHCSSISTRMAETRRTREASLGKTRILRVRRFSSCWIERSMGSSAHGPPWSLGSLNTAGSRGRCFLARCELGRGYDIGHEPLKLLLRASQAWGIPNGASSSPMALRMA